MKILNSIILICVLAFVTACSKDDDITKVNNTGTLTIKGVEYELVDGIIWDRIEERGEDIYNFDIDLFGEGIDPENETGLGHLAAMELFTDLSDDLAPGTYKHDIDGTYPAGTFCGNIVLDINFDTDEVSTWYTTTSGNITMKKTGDVYEFSMNLIADEYDVIDDFDFIKTDSDVAINCVYKGTLAARMEVID